MALGTTHALTSRMALTTALIKREIAGRYRGSVLGILWSLITPLLMLGVYTFVFGTVFKGRWSGANGSSSIGSSSSEFAIVLFAGLLIFQFFSEVVVRTPTLIVSNSSYVKKIVFPLEILPLVAMGSALFHASVSLVVLVVAIVVTRGGLPFTALWLPAILVPFLMLIAGMSWFLAALGVYSRDISQVLGTVVTALMFLSPIFFPASALPAWLQPWLFANPLSLPIEQARAVLIWGQTPDLGYLAIYAAVSTAICISGLGFFQTTRKGFADVL